ncbi:MAG: efflux RND transporter permease subunit [Candidatus Solibacter usitatus]|nr:efflux RND transporter permease subunit [Candidatus Solibacter usitatus]
MNASGIFIRRPVATSLLMFALAVFGALAYRFLPVSDLPNVDFPTLVVSANLPGANPDTMASAVATPLERQFTSIAGLDSMISVNSTGSTSVTLQFSLDRDLDGASVDVQTAIAACIPLLPPGMPNPPSFRKYNPSDSPIMFLGLVSETMPLYDLQDIAETKIAQRLSTVPGVAQANVFGAQRFAVRVQADPDKLAAKRIGINEVSAALRSWNVNLPTGTLWGEKQAFNIRANGQLRRAEDFQPLIIAYRGGAPIRLQDVATVVNSVEDNKTGSWLYQKGVGMRGLNVAIMKQPSSNVIQTNDQIRALLPEIRKQLPAAVTLKERGDRSRTIRDAFHDIESTMMIAMTLVILVIFLFLRNARATFIPAVALPLSLFGTLAVMLLLGYSLNNLSMMALILSVGFVVDDAIVMLENIVRHIEKGESVMQAAVTGSKEISFTIVSMTVSLGAVFIPILFMGGLLGRLFKEFAVTICLAIFFSGFISISLTPMLCSRLLKVHQPHKMPWFFRITETFYSWTLKLYEISLRWVLLHRPVMLVVFFATIGLTAYLFEIVPKGFIPDQDSDSMYVNSEAAQGISYYQMAEYQQKIAEIVSSDPNVESDMASAGGMHNTSSNSARHYITLLPRSERDKSVQQIIETLRPKVGSLPGARAFLTAPPSIRLGGRSSKSQYEYTLQGPDVKELYREAQRLQTEILKLPSVADVTSDLQIKNPRLQIKVDRDRVASLGLNMREVSNSLYDAFGPRWSSTIYAPNNQYRVLLEILPKYQAHPDLLSKLYFKTNTGVLIPMDSVASTYTDAGPLTINHSGQLPAVTLSFNIRAGFALGSVVDEVEELAATLPKTIATSFQGTAKAFQDSLANITVLLILAVMVVYIALGILYESYIHPLTILSGLPSAALGALISLLVCRSELNIYAFVGLFMLIGIVKKNAIMQIDFALEAERNEHKSARDAIYEGCIIRFRPILMTTLAALFGVLPIALGTGSGGEARRPLGITVVGGLIISQLVTLYLTPVVYTYLDGIVDWWQSLGRRRTPHPAPASAGD